MKSQADRTELTDAEPCERCGANYCDACGVRIVEGGEMRWVFVPDERLARLAKQTLGIRRTKRTA